MDGHFRTFSFVDRITQVDGGVVRGHYTIPAAVDSFPTSLVTEAVGQLAAWAAMVAVDFSHRPVAGIAGKIELLSAVRPGQVLELAAELESVDNEAVGYSGMAHADGVPVVRLHDCVGPMVPVEEFDDPQSVRDRYALLLGAGAAPGAFAGLPALLLDRKEGKRGQIVRAILQVPVEAPFFADHFPRRPVFPGTLLMQANLEAAWMLAAEVPADGIVWRPRNVANVKLRTFIAPGETVALEVERIEESDDTLCVIVESRIGQRLISSAEIQFVREAQP